MRFRTLSVSLPVACSYCISVGPARPVNRRQTLPPLRVLNISIPHPAPFHVIVCLFLRRGYTASGNDAKTKAGLLKELRSLVRAESFAPPDSTPTGSRYEKKTGIGNSMHVPPPLAPPPTPLHSTPPQLATTVLMPSHSAVQNNTGSL